MGLGPAGEAQPLFARTSRIPSQESRPATKQKPPRALLEEGMARRTLRQPKPEQVNPAGPAVQLSDGEQHSEHPQSVLPPEQRDTHAPETHDWPHAQPPGQPVGMQVSVDALHSCPAPHDPKHRPPQPSEPPQATPAGQLGAHTQVPPEQNSPPGHAPLVQVPPQPSGPPQFTQLGAQAHVPPAQNSPPGHAPVRHVPPQPSGPPHGPLPLHVGAHTHA